MRNPAKRSDSGLSRATILYLIVGLVGTIFIGRLFYLQIIQHEYYSDLALASHETSYKIPANRGKILARDGDSSSPLVLNEVLPTVFADQRYVEDPESTAKQLRGIIGGNVKKMTELLTGDRVYMVITKKVSREQAIEIEEAEIPGIGLQDESYRVYPEGQIAAQSLGFVNGEGSGQYGVEEFLDEELSGKEGILEAITDVNNVPLTTNDDNIILPAQDGKDITLTIDINIQRFVEQALREGVKSAKGKSGSAIVVDPHTGAVLAMANYPTFKPEEFQNVKDYTAFQNAVIEDPYEVGSVVKTLTMSAGLNEGVVTPSSSYYDSGSVTVGDRVIENAGVANGVTRDMREVIKRSVNTGVVHVLKLLGGGKEINDKSRETLYNYFTKQFGFGNPTGIALAGELGGSVFKPDHEEGNAIRYANMTFGQGMTVTMLQMAAAVSSITNGGDYYKPYIVHSSTVGGYETISDPQVLRDSVVSEKTSEQIRSMMEGVVKEGGGQVAKRDGYRIGGKTGTSQVIDKNTGEYSDTLENGSFVGFGGNSEVKYVIMSRVNEPKIPGYAGTVAAAPIFADISNFLIDYLRIPPNQ